MLVLNNIKKTFTGNVEPILKGVHLELNRGDFCTLIGSNGSGKSTLMKVISGEYGIDEGFIMIDDKNVTHQERGFLISEVTQDINKGTIPEMTLLENLSLSHMSTKKEEWMAKIRALEVGLEQYIDQKLSTLSGGQRQLIATLMAVHSRSKMVLLDEHTSALDPKMQKFLMEYTKNSIEALNLTAIMITHNISDAIKYGNRLIVMNNGEIVLNVSGQAKSSLTIADILYNSGGFQ